MFFQFVAEHGQGSTNCKNNIMNLRKSIEKKEIIERTAKSIKEDEINIKEEDVTHSYIY